MPASIPARCRSWCRSATCAPSRPTPSPSRKAPGSPYRRPIRRRAASTTCAAPPRAMSAGRESGFTLLGLLLVVGVMGAGLAAYGQIYSHQAQREKEAELLFVGNQFRQAIAAYYERTPGAV